MVRIPDLPFRETFSFDDATEAFLLKEGLPFAEILSEERITRIFQKHRSIFGGIYTTGLLVWAFPGQVLRDGKEASCQSAVARIVSYLQLAGRATPTRDTGDYCKARAKLSEHALKELSCEVAKEVEENARPDWLWKGRHAKLVDGFTFKMPDTPENQKEYPQHTAQKPGLGFPIARVACIISLATTCLFDAALAMHGGQFVPKLTNSQSVSGLLLVLFIECRSLGRTGATAASHAAAWAARAATSKPL